MVVLDGWIFVEGDVIMVDGISGEVLVGELFMCEVVLDGVFCKLLNWVEEYCDIGICVNVDMFVDV